MSDEETQEKEVRKAKKVKKVRAVKVRNNHSGYALYRHNNEVRKVAVVDLRLYNGELPKTQEFEEQEFLNLNKPDWIKE